MTRMAQTDTLKEQPQIAHQRCQPTSAVGRKSRDVTILTLSATQVPFDQLLYRCGRSQPRLGIDQLCSRPGAVSMIDPCWFTIS